MPENDWLSGLMSWARGDEEPSEPRTPRYAEVSSGAPRTTGPEPGVKMYVESHGYVPEKAPRMAEGQEMTRYTRAQRDDIKAADAPAPAAPAPPPGVTPEALAAALAFLKSQGQGR